MRGEEEGSLVAKCWKEKTVKIFGLNDCQGK